MELSQLLELSKLVTYAEDNFWGRSLDGTEPFFWQGVMYLYDLVVSAYITFT